MRIAEDLVNTISSVRFPQSSNIQNENFAVFFEISDLQGSPQISASEVVSEKMNFHMWAKDFNKILEITDQVLYSSSPIISCENASNTIIYAATSKANFPEIIPHFLPYSVEQCHGVERSGYNFNFGKVSEHLLSDMSGVGVSKFSGDISGSAYVLSTTCVEYAQNKNAFEVFDKGRNDFAEDLEFICEILLGFPLIDTLENLPGKRFLEVPPSSVNVNEISLHVGDKNILLTTDVSVCDAEMDIEMHRFSTYEIEKIANDFVPKYVEMWSNEVLIPIGTRLSEYSLYHEGGQEYFFGGARHMVAENSSKRLAALRSYFPEHCMEGSLRGALKYVPSDTSIFDDERSIAFLNAGASLSSGVQLHNRSMYVEPALDNGLDNTFLINLNRPSQLSTIMFQLETPLDSPEADIFYSDGDVNLSGVGENLGSEESAVREVRSSFLTNGHSTQRGLDLSSRIVQQVAEGMNRISISGGDGVTELRLSPDELGSVRIEIRSEGDRVNILFLVERQDVLDLMRRHVDKLAGEFRNFGFTQIDMNFECFSEHGRNQNSPTSEVFDVLAIDGSLENVQGLPLTRHIFSAGSGIYLRF